METRQRQNETRRETMTTTDTSRELRLFLTVTEAGLEVKEFGPGPITTTVAVVRTREELDEAIAGRTKSMDRLFEYEGWTMSVHVSSSVNFASEETTDPQVIALCSDIAIACRFCSELR